MLPPVLYGAGLLVSLALHRLHPQPLVPRPLSYQLGVMLLAASAALGVWAHHVMKKAGTNVDPRKPSTVIVTSGPFRLTRNPLYVALTLAFLGLGLLVDDAWFLPVLAVVLVVLDAGVVRREERYLLKKFGEEYRQYTERVRRWL